MRDKWIHDLNPSHCEPVVDIRKIAAALIAVALLVGIARAQTPDQERTAQELRDAEAVSKRHRAELMKIPHVKVVTGEVDPRNEAAILLEVDDQKNVDEVMRKAPSRIEGFPVEVDEAEDTNDETPIEPEDSGANRFPTIDENGNHHHTWLKPAAPLATPATSQ